MKTLGDLLLRHEPFSEIVMGNTAIVRAMIEAGTQVVSSYPGSPTPEIAEAIKSIPKAKRPFYLNFPPMKKLPQKLLTARQSTVIYPQYFLKAWA